MLALPQPKRLFLSASLSYIAKCVGKSSGQDDLIAAFHGALCDNALVASGKLVTYENPHWKEETVTSSGLKVIPPKVWKQFTDNEFRDWIYKEYVPVDLLKSLKAGGSSDDPPYYHHPTIATADIDAWLSAHNGNKKEQVILKPAAEKSLGTRERETLLQIILGMAIDKYGYDASKPDQRSNVPKAIEDALVRANVIHNPPKAETILKKLRAAAGLSEEND